MRPSSDCICRCPVALRRIVRQATDGEPSTTVDLWSCKPNRIRELTLKFSGSAAGLIGDSSHFLGVDSIEGYNQVSGKGFPTTGPRIEAGNVVIHRGLYTLMPGRSVYCSYVNGLCCELELYVDGIKSLKVRLIRASFGITRLICVSFGITRLICASFGITRLIGVSFGVTRLIRASFGIARLMCKGTARDRPTRGKKDA
ncbi:hypothetical protein E5676_scaffold32G00430 [Cucumis melo var. makuwa]|uniref:Ty3-gypsy retrotransposon protein n=1 Tax=Cucumis melo var. makuwa TaxID=1194695 RepID=A0A5A7THY3_CUCMM|nr:hypothetical protein E6C27_scaffold128G002110 [Cucumis melo var. makuwa]TYK16038.1 hypothetical protein E5676_scaffold32G00430 [Cucumis melo var. makuwa]